MCEISCDITKPLCTCAAVGGWGVRAVWQVPRQGKHELGQARRHQHPATDGRCNLRGGAGAERRWSVVDVSGSHAWSSLRFAAVRLR